MRLLGGFLVEVDGHPVQAEAWRHRRGADLVKLLALAPQHKLHRDQVMERLWPELGGEAAGANLRKAVHYARRALGGLEAITTDGDMVALWPEGPLQVDAERALSGGGRIETALDLFAGELLPEDRYADWTEPYRERLRARRLELLRAAGRWDQVLELDPADEVACRALMRACLERGNRQDAIRQFQRLREVLRVDLGVAPEPATIGLFEAALAMQGPQASVALEQAQALLARGLMHWSASDLDAAERLAHDARSLAAEHHLGRELGEACTLLGMVAMARGRWLEVFKQDFVAAMERSEHAPVLLDAHLCLAEASLAVNSESVARLAPELLQLAKDADSTPGEALISMLIGETEFFSGHLGKSQEWLSRATDLYGRLDGGSGLAFALIRLADVAVAGDLRSEAARQLSAARQLTDRSELAPHLRARVLEAMIKTAEDPDQYPRLLGEAESLLLHPLHLCGPCSIGLRVSVAITYAGVGDVAHARRWLGDAERIVGMWSSAPWQAGLWEARAAVRRAEGDGNQAGALLREAANLFAQSGRPMDADRCLSAMAAGA